MERIHLAKIGSLRSRMRISVCGRNEVNSRSAIPHWPRLEACHVSRDKTSDRRQVLIRTGLRSARSWSTSSSHDHARSCQPVQAAFHCIRLHWRRSAYADLNDPCPVSNHRPSKKQSTFKHLYRNGDTREDYCGARDKGMASKPRQLDISQDPFRYRDYTCPRVERDTR